MGNRYHPLTCAQVESILKFLGFTPRPQTSGTTHVNWVKYDCEGRLLGKVTVDCHHAPYSQDLIGYMVKQSGVSKKYFYSILEKI